MSWNAIEMHRLQELVRLHRMHTAKRDVARLVGVSPNTERQYRQALEQAGLLDGAVTEIPELAILQAAVRDALPPKQAPQQVSSIDTWAETIETMLKRDVQPQAIYDCLRLEHPEFRASLSAVKRLVARLKAAQPVTAGTISGWLIGREACNDA